MSTLGTILFLITLAFLVGGEIERRRRHPEKKHEIPKAYIWLVIILLVLVVSTLLARFIL